MRPRVWRHASPSSLPRPRAGGRSARRFPGLVRDRPCGLLPRRVMSRPESVDLASRRPPSSSHPLLSSPTTAASCVEMSCTGVPRPCPHRHVPLGRPRSHVRGARSLSPPLALAASYTTAQTDVTSSLHTRGGQCPPAPRPCRGKRRAKKREQGRPARCVISNTTAGGTTHPLVCHLSRGGPVREVVR